AGFSALVMMISKDSSAGPDGFTSMQLLDKLRLDIAGDKSDGGAKFDGTTKDGTMLSLGTCPRECQLSGLTLRSDFADGMDTFFRSPRNLSHVETNAVSDFFSHVSVRDIEMFPQGGTHDFDTTAPDIAVIENHVQDEDTLQPSIHLDPPNAEVIYQ